MKEKPAQPAPVSIHSTIRRWLGHLFWSKLPRQIYTRQFAVHLLVLILGNNCGFQLFKSKSSIIFPSSFSIASALHFLHSLLCRPAMSNHTSWSGRTARAALFLGCSSHSVSLWRQTVVSVSLSFHWSRQRSPAQSPAKSGSSIHLRHLIFGCSYPPVKSYYLNTPIQTCELYEPLQHSTWTNEVFHTGQPHIFWQQRQIFDAQASILTWLPIESIKNSPVCFCHGIKSLMWKPLKCKCNTFHCANFVLSCASVTNVLLCVCILMVWWLLGQHHTKKYILISWVNFGTKLEFGTISYE